jgi:DNA-binding MarR family transcriptional regulator
MGVDLPPPPEDAWPDGAAVSPGGLGPALRRAWLGYQLRLDAAMAEAGFGERRFPDGRVLRLCATETGSTITAIGRELDITRQGAGKVVGRLRDNGYVTVADSATSGREKSVRLTARGVDYLRTQHAAARAIEDDLRAAVGESGFSALHALLDALDDQSVTQLRPYLRRSTEL